MYVYETGASNAATIVLLHGGGMGGWSWQPEIERLPDYHLLVPDLPGQGQSLSEGPFTFREAASKVAETIRRYAHGGKAHVAGLSLGAQTLIHLCSVAPEVVVSAFATGTLARKLPGAGLIRPMLALYHPIKDTPIMVRANMRSFGVPKEYYDGFARDTRDASIDSMAAIFEANMSFELPAGLDKITIPVLLTVGEKEYGMMKQSARKLAAAMPGARAYLVRGVGHNWPLTRPDLYTQTLQAWLVGANLPAELTPLS
jgi:pimeloyl-ACP methyl ester carboxylesterase